MHFHAEAPSVKGIIFQASCSQGSVIFLLTVAQNGNYFSFHYELSLFHLGTEMIDFHSSPILPSLKPVTRTDTMQNAGDRTAYVGNFGATGGGEAFACRGFVILNIY